MDIIKEHLLIPTKYMILTDERICLTAHRNWLSRFLTVGPLNFICHDRLSNDEIAAQPTIDELGGDWLKIYAKVFLTFSIVFFANCIFNILSKVYNEISM